MSMSESIRVSIVGGSGYTGGELLRLALFHPHLRLAQITSGRLPGKYVYTPHPNLRGVTELKFSHPDDLAPCDVLFLCLPHGEAARNIGRYKGIAPRIIDCSSDFRLKDPADYRKWYHD